MPYEVFVDDNFHYMDESSRYGLGQFATLEAALDASRKIVDEFLLANYEPGMTAESLLTSYKMGGEDPFIIPVAPHTNVGGFSAWKYAEQRCAELCGRGQSA